MRWLLPVLALMVATRSTASQANTHWAFQPATRPSVPPPGILGSGQNPIDRFILATLDQKKLAPSPEADRHTLIRRLYFDLTGLPPTPQEVRDFTEDRSPAAYERLVDRLLASPRYGERWA